VIDAHIKSPGRLCLLGEHQDYFRLDVLSGAITLYLHIWGVRRCQRVARLRLHDLNRIVELDLSQDLAYTEPRDYLRSCVNVLRRKGLSFSHGFDAEIKGFIPIGKGTSSSSALVMAWLGFLWTMADDPPPFPSPESLAWLGYEAEVAEFGEPGGMQDHFAMAMGGLIHLSCGEPFRVASVSARPAGFLLADSRVVKDTVGVISRIKQGVAAALSSLGHAHGNFAVLRSLPRSPDQWKNSGSAPEDLRLLDATLATRDLTATGVALLQGSWSPSALAELIREQHRWLRDGLAVSTPLMERLMAEAYAAGALACKVNGSGGGGCFLIYAPGAEQRVINRLTREGTAVYPLEFSPGTGPAGIDDIPIILD